MMLVLNRKGLSLLWLLPLCAMGVLGVSPRIHAQDAKDKAPPQKELIDDKTREVHEGEVVFAFNFPKSSKFKDIKAKWKFVDLEARKARVLSEIDSAIAEGEKQEPKDEERLGKLRKQRQESANHFAQSKLRLEALGDPDQVLEVLVTSVDAATTMDKVGPKAFAARTWRSTEFILDRDTTSKSLRKSGGESHTYQFTAEPLQGGKSLYYHMDMYLVTGKDGNRYRVLVMHRIPKDLLEKKSLKDSALLLRCLQFVF